MEKFSLRKALQKKNMMAGEIKKLQNLIASKNSYVDGAPEGSREDVKALMVELGLARANLIALKTAVTKANVGIYGTLCELDELKSYISFLDTVQSREGVHRLSDTNVVIWLAQYSEKEIRSMKADIQKQLEVLQERVDEFNTITYIEV